MDAEYQSGVTQYAGMYVPCGSCVAIYLELSPELIIDIADYIYKKKAPLDLSLQGIWIADRM